MYYRSSCGTGNRKAYKCRFENGTGQWTAENYECPRDCVPYPAAPGWELTSCPKEGA